MRTQPLPTSSVAASHTTAAGSPAAVLAVFAAAGFVMAQTLARVPAIRDQVGAGTAELGLALVGGGAGSLLTMPFTARLVERWGSRTVTRVALVLACLGWGAVGLVGSVVALAAVLLGAGAFVGVWDVAMNIEAAEVERRRGRSWMPYFHAAFSGGTVLGAAAGALAAGLGVGPVQVPALAVVALGVGLLTVRGFRGRPAAGMPAADVSDAAAGIGPTTTAGPGRRGVTGTEVLIGLVCLGAALAEGAANDWLALLLVDVHGAPEALGALTFTAFALTMFLGRLGGGAAVVRLGRVPVVRAGGGLAVVGILLLTLVTSVPVALVGSLLWGLGVATIFPACMSAAAEVPGRGARAIGTVSTIAYGAFLFGAPVIGLLAEHLGLDRALWVVVALLGVMVLLAGHLRPRRLPVR